MINVHVTQKVLRKLRSEAIRMFPCESFASLLGKTVDGVTEISDIWVPEDLKKFSANNCVVCPDHWIEVGFDYAEERDLEVVGSHHSHPYTFRERKWLQTQSQLNRITVPSFGDWQCEWSNIAGITGIVEEAPGSRSKYRTLTKFYGPAVSVKLYVQ